jgi:hypothetical protein
MQLGYCTHTSAFLKDSGKWSLDAIERSVAHKGKDGDAVRAAYHRGAHWAERVELAQWWGDYLDTLRTIKGRTTRDGIALVEIKDDGEDGRLHSEKNRLKIQVQHREYRNVFWSYETDKGFLQLGFNEALNMIQPLRPFDIARMVLLHN